MKVKILALAILLSGTSTFAANKAVTSTAHTCSELKQLLTQNQSLLVRGTLGSRIVHTRKSQCDTRYSHIARKAAWKTKDTRFCTVGFVCLDFIGRG